MSRYTWYCHKQEVVNLHTCLLESLIYSTYMVCLYTHAVYTQVTCSSSIWIFVPVWWMYDGELWNFVTTKIVWVTTHWGYVVLRENKCLKNVGGGLKGCAIPLVRNLLTSDLLRATGLLQGPWELAWLHSQSPLQPVPGYPAFFCYSWCDVWNMNSLTAVNDFTVLFVIMYFLI